MPLDQLHCPTCGVKYEDFRLHSDPEEFDILAPVSDIIAHPEPWFILCPKGHKWTVKTLWRFAGTQPRPDEVQLDRYIGQR